MSPPESIQLQESTCSMYKVDHNALLTGWHY
jgi:hypothetical protein